MAQVPCFATPCRNKYSLRFASNGIFALPEVKDLNWVLHVEFHETSERRANLLSCLTRRDKYAEVFTSLGYSAGAAL